MKRPHIELLLSWRDAPRRRDLKAVGSTPDDDMAWQGLRAVVRRGRQKVIDVKSCDGDHEIDSLELIEAPEQFLVGVRIPICATALAQR